MNVTRWLPILILLLPLASQADSWSKTIVEDRGHFEKSKVDSKKICEEVVNEELALQKRYDPDFNGKIVVKSHTQLEVYRTDSSFGHAAKCILEFQRKDVVSELKAIEEKAAQKPKLTDENLLDE